MGALESLQLLGKRRVDKEVKSFLGQHEMEIEQIESDWIYSSYGEGFEIRFEGKPLTTIIFYVEDCDNEGYEPYKGELPNGLRATDGRATVRQKLGPPCMETVDADLIRLDDYFLRVQYPDKKGEKIAIVQVSSRPSLDHLFE